MSKKSAVEKSGAQSDNRPMTEGEIATALRKKTKGAADKRGAKKTALKKKAKKSKQ